METLHSHFQPSCHFKMFKIRDLEAEKLTFRGELSFQRLECTAGLTVATSFVVVVKNSQC
jgi:hypothetical protein